MPIPFIITAQKDNLFQTCTYIFDPKGPLQLEYRSTGHNGLCAPVDKSKLKTVNYVTMSISTYGLKTWACYL